MSALRPNEENMHYGDGSHRWTPPNGWTNQGTWEERVREHQRQHRAPAESRQQPPVKLRLVS